jgi:tRNA dimethylallyltransferase
LYYVVPRLLVQKSPIKLKIINKSHEKKPRVAALVGATAVGKTAVALALAAGLGAEIVNADSLQVYRELDIGTAKPTIAERALVPHHLIDVADPPEPYDAARFCREGRAVLGDLARRGVPPLVVGGTGLYLRALLGGLFPQGEPPPGVRDRVRQELASLGLPVLYARLIHLDPATASRLHPHDTYRIVRALEVMAATGKPLSEFIQAHRFQDAPYEVLTLGLRLDREELYRRIDLRVELMLEAGWLDEIEGLLERYPPTLKPLQALGYRHLINYLTGVWSWDEALTLLSRDTRRYAKRQHTWFGSDPSIRWFHPDQVADMAAALKEFFG